MAGGDSLPTFPSRLFWGFLPTHAPFRSLFYVCFLSTFWLGDCMGIMNCKGNFIQIRSHTCILASEWNCFLIWKAHLGRTRAGGFRGCIGVQRGLYFLTCGWHPATSRLTARVRMDHRRFHHIELSVGTSFATNWSVQVRRVDCVKIEVVKEGMVEVSMGRIRQGTDGRSSGRAEDDTSESIVHRVVTFAVDLD
ncbi:hypothetical protein K505DRAFT_115204 [Melanomma pulvis-pyrius CBS 109.77]|uniref:Uncharacterized protein n=1 Tax=Melanomma pulvis-pyrius CBS 109.77 TaxID=1314802 RepID=A0A6A6WWD8_9PLEO|nr:hypothetical protein K505DRAFT_115204 [Melanomma pulvis-pyrius CBS 109.77]